MQLTLWPLLTCALCVCPPSGHKLRCNLTQEKKYRVTEALQACQALPNETITLLWQCPHYHLFCFFSFVIAHPNRMWTDQNFPKNPGVFLRIHSLCHGSGSLGLVLLSARSLRSSQQKHNSDQRKTVSVWFWLAVHPPTSIELVDNIVFFLTISLQV